ncbi:Fic family protein [Actinomyces qiguomingii]|uniref:Fic family protein n=1 Tax=Actinomyces qiguomingii TaxID=2057800 RepID=UPI0018EB17E4|nr:Fic family protein [Actinomyces qiguomingii]
MSGQVAVPRTYDADHVRAIHGYLFQDVYEWAGQYRSVNMSKNFSSFADVRAGEIDRYLADVQN